MFLSFPNTNLWIRCSLIYGVLQSYEQEQRCLRWRDITFFRCLKGSGNYLLITFQWLKGQQDGNYAEANLFCSAEFLILPCRRPENLIADLTWILLYLAIERGSFENRSLEQLVTAPESILKQDWKFTDELVFPPWTAPTHQSLTARRPLLSLHSNPPLQQWCREADPVAYVTTYVWWWEFVIAVACNSTREEALEFAMHKTSSSSSYDYYDFGTGDKDIAEIRLLRM